MANYIVRRLLLMLPTLLGATMVVFFVIALSPGGISAALLGREAELRPEARKAREEYLQKRYGLNDPPWKQYLRWLNKISPVGMRSAPTGESGGFGFKAPDLGDSFVQARRVWPIIKERLPTTLMLNLIAYPLIYAIALTTGIQAARHRGQLADVAIGTVLIALWSIPVIWSSVLLIGFFANSAYFQWFPAQDLSSLRSNTMSFLPSFTGGFRPGYLLDRAWHLVLPIICMTYGGFAFLSKLSRGSLLETIQADFVRTARAKGLPEGVVIYRHVLRNSLIPMITFAAALLPAMVTGSVVVETTFGLPGMGRLAVESVQQRDFELFLAVTLMTVVLSMVATLLADMLYVVADPRVSYDS